MPADFSNYIDLSLFDLEPGDIYRDSLELARLSLPQFELRTGTPEDAIFQAMAYVSALNISAINRLPNRLMSGLVSILGFTRQEGIAAEVDVLFTLNTYDGGIIPAGTVVSYSAFFENELQEFAFQTLEAVDIEPTNLAVTSNYPTAVITCSCLTLGIISPLSANAVLDVVSAGTNIYSAAVASPSNFANGINADTDTEYLSAASTYLRSLSSVINKSGQLDAFILSTYPGVIGRVKSYDLTNGDTVSGNINVYRTSQIIKTFRDGVTSIGTIQTNAPHLFVTGESIRLDDCGIFTDGNYTILGTSASTMVFTSVGGNSASTVVSGSAYAGEDVSGYVSVFAYGINSFLTASEKQGVLAAVVDTTTAGLTLNMLDPTLVQLSLSADVVIDNAYDTDTLTDAIKNAIADYLSPNKYPFNLDRIRATQMISLIANIPGVVYVDSLSLTPTGDGWLPVHGNDLLFRKKGTLPLISKDDITLVVTVFET